MSLHRRAVAHSEICFGRRLRGGDRRDRLNDGHDGWSDDLRLFALTFTGGFLFVLVYLL